MREYLFRGMLPDLSKWIFGSLIVKGNKIYIVDQTNETITEVVPQSVGQFIGSYYKESKHPIYEGDIVEAWSTGSKGTFLVKYDNGPHPGFKLWPAWQQRMFWSIHPSTGSDRKLYDDLTKIGTIFENPSLIPNAN